MSKNTIDKEKCKFYYVFYGFLISIVILLYFINNQRIKINMYVRDNYKRKFICYSLREKLINNNNNNNIELNLIIYYLLSF